MNPMTKLKIAAAVASLFVSLVASATPYNEIGDAGQTLATAQVVPGGTSVIVGNVSGDADLFKFGWGGGSFYVNSVGGTVGDSQLFLFNSAGVGIQGNDDGIAYAGPAYLQLGALAAGQYFIGISSYDYDPYSSAGMIFPSNPYQPLYGPSNLSPLSYWGGGSYHNGSYSINFQQITSNGDPIGNPNPTGNVPETSSSIALLGLGLAGLAMIRRHKKT
jgi:hypothetical protein